jgi:serine/threonine protein kinase
MALRIKSSGGLYVLDSRVEQSFTQRKPRFGALQLRPLAAITQIEDANIEWLKKLHTTDFMYSNVKFRHGFSRVANRAGLFSSNKWFSVHLMEAWPPHLQDKAITFKQESISLDCVLVCVKIAKNAEALRRLERETVAMQALQSTGYVVELHFPALTSVFLSRGMQITRYCAVPPPQERGFETSLSLLELEDTLEGIANALVSVHSNGWAWLNLNHGHVLVNHAHHDERDSQKNLSILGLENAITGDSLKNSDSFIFTGEISWAAPEFKLFLSSSAAQHRVSSDQTSVMTLPFFATCDMFSLGLLMLCYLARTVDPVQAQRVASTREALSSSFNIPIFDTSKEIQSNSYLISLAMDLIETDPQLRPTAEEVLQRIRAGRVILPLQLESFTIEIPGRIHGETLQMVWPVLLKSKVTTDQRDKTRLTDYMQVFAAMETPKGKVVADYDGRRVSKQYLRWLRHLGLHTHALNDGDESAFDGRRKCNGVYDTAFYVFNGKVTSLSYVKWPSGL